MDLLFKRYASPFILLDGYIKTARFCEFIREFAEIKKEDDTWEFFLHKVWDKSYDEFCESVKTANAVMEMTESEIKTTVENSLKILGSFNPEKERE
jgi:hypothetical protein